MYRDKKNIDIYGAMPMPPEADHELVYQKSIEAVKNFANCGPYSFGKNVDCVVEVTERTHIPNIKNTSYIKIIDDRTFLVEASNAEELTFRTMI